VHKQTCSSGYFLSVCLSNNKLCSLACVLVLRTPSLGTSFDSVLTYSDIHSSESLIKSWFDERWNDESPVQTGKDLVVARDLRCSWDLGLCLND